MDGHTIVYQPDRPYSAYCSCKQWESGQKDHRWQVEDLANLHLAGVRRARAANKRQPSLRQIGQYYRYMAENGPDEESRERWNMLALEVEDRIASKTMSDEGQDPLF